MPRTRGAAGSGGRRELLSAGDVARAVARMAHQVIEKTTLGAAGAAPVVLVGIPTRGAPLAQRLAARVAEFSGVTVRFPRRFAGGGVSPAEVSGRTRPFRAGSATCPPWRLPPPA
ncbi:phosphoribosyltransferase family protein, partial [Kibdelosporangium lantanae]